MIKIDENDLLDLIHWARRYADGRSTHVPFSFNLVYENIRKLNPEICSSDRFDHTLTNKGQWWPYAQDGMYDSDTGRYNAAMVTVKKE